jgi:mRNA interferase YafQ
LTLITSQFKKDFKKAVKSGKEIDLLIEIIEKLAKKETLPPKNKDHSPLGVSNAFVIRC